jgi:hypothetical protein
MKASLILAALSLTEPAFKKKYAQDKYYDDEDYKKYYSDDYDGKKDDDEPKKHHHEPKKDDYKKDDYKKDAYKKDAYKPKHDYGPGPSNIAGAPLKCPTFKHCKSKFLRSLRPHFVSSTPAGAICVYDATNWNSCNLSPSGSSCRLGTRFFGASEIACNVWGHCELKDC